MRYLLALLLLAGVYGTVQAGDWTIGSMSPPTAHVSNEVTITGIGEWIEYRAVEGKQLDELIEAAEGVLPYLNAPSDRMESVTITDLVYRGIPTELETAQREVERLKEKDAAIKRFREALERAKDGK